ncbi:hypothetical protein JCM12856_11650 [Spirochaeta dissipatitropha]
MLALYLATRISRKCYLSLTLLSASTLMYVVAEIFLAIILENGNTGMYEQIFIFQKLISAVNIFFLLLFVSDVLSPDSRQRTISKFCLSTSGLLLGIIVIGTLTQSNLLWSSGETGILWQLDRFLVILASTSALFLLAMELSSSHRWAFIGLILTGIAGIVAAYISDSLTGLSLSVELYGVVRMLPVALTILVFFSAAAVILEFIRKDIELNKTQERLSFLVYHDELTGLLNRQALNGRLERAVSITRRSESDQCCGLLIIDLDHFKRINDGIGHDVGDGILKAFAERIKSRIRTTDSFFRTGGDEFAVILHNLKQAIDAAVVAEKILASMEEPFVIKKDPLYLGCTIGISIYPKDADTADELMIRADSALSEAKSERSVYRFYTRQMQLTAIRRMKILRNLRQAMKEQEFHLVYQPQISPDGHIIGAEALLRWNNQELGSISPVEFIPIAEESNTIIPIGNWVIEQACAASRYWSHLGLPEFPVAVNLSAKQLRSEDLVPHIHTCLQRYELNPSRLHIEITESSVLDNPEAAIAILHRIHSLGISIAIDDFGTGFSSLSYLKELPVDYVKIDRSFFLELPDDSKSASLVLGIISMVGGLGMKLIAEGVESAGQVSFLHANAPICIQGYFYSKPLQAEDFILFVKNHAEPVGNRYYTAN